MEPPQYLTAPDSIFNGPFGLRAGWSISLYIAILAFFFIVGTVGVLALEGRLDSTVAEYAHPQKPAAIIPAETLPAKTTDGLQPGNSLLSESFQFFGLLGAAAILARIERRRSAVYGIGRYRFADILPGAFWGLTTLSLLIALLRACHWLTFDSRALHGSAIATYGLRWLAVFLFVGLLEEYLLRGFLQYTLTRGLLGLGKKINPTHARATAFWLAAFVMSCLFAYMHIDNSGESVMGLCMVFVVGFVFSYALWRTGSLWWGIGYHMAWDWAQSFLFGVRDSGLLSAGRLFNTHPVGSALQSGGHAGPEGSLLVLPILLLTLVIIRYTTKPGIQPPLEPESLTPQEAHPLIA